jgi:hypothetical protein
MSIWQGVAMDSLQFHLGLPCPSFLRPVVGPPLKLPYIHFRDGPPAWRAACGRILPLWTPHAVRLYRLWELKGEEQILLLFLLFLSRDSTASTRDETASTHSLSLDSPGFFSDRPTQECYKKARISWGMHGLSKLLLGPAMLYHSMPCGPPLVHCGLIEFSGY